MVLDLDELEPIIEEVLDKVRRNLLIANRMGKLEDYLGTLGLDGLIQEEDGDSFSYKNGVIVVLGGSRVSENVLTGIGRSCGLDKDRFEFCLDYDEIESYPFKKLQYNAKYRVVLVGPVPHSSSGKGDFSSTIVRMEETPGYPRVVRLCSNDELKITKTNFRNVLTDLLAEGYIAC
jgi:hypothetical protein